MTFFTIFQALLDHYVASALGLLVAGYWLPRVRRLWLRSGLFAFLTLLMPALLLIAGVAAGCPSRDSSSPCYGIGFGLVIAITALAPISALCLGIGLLFRLKFGPISRLLE